MKNSPTTTKDALRYELAEWQEEIESIEEMLESDDPDYCIEDEDIARKALGRIEFCIELEAELGKHGATLEPCDYSSASEALYFYASDEERCLKVRVAEHYSNYDKDIDIVAQSFTGHTCPSPKEWAKSIADELVNAS